MGDFIAIPAITVVCYLLAEIFKSVAKEVQYRHIPVLCGVSGGILGAVSFVAFPGYIPAENLLVAVGTGIVSGWAATGINQSIKQQMEE